MPEGICENLYIKQKICLVPAGTTLVPAWIHRDNARVRSWTQHDSTAVKVQYKIET